jgi:predicted NBD/HSP70 family sugar kinase
MATRSAATQDELRRHNLARLLRRLHERGAASRSELVAFTGLNRSTVGVLVSELADVGLVYEGAGSAGQVGRPSLVVQPQPSSAVVVAFDLRVERTIAALVGLGGDVIMHKEQLHRRASYTPEAAVRNVVSLVSTALSKAPENSSWVGVGIGVPGVVDHADGLVRFAPNLGWVDVPLGEMVREALTAAFGDAPSVRIGNDADLGAIAEHARGLGVTTGNLIYLSGEVGIGGGIIIDGRPMAGAGGYGGEVGHMSINPNGSICRCGAQGCWETEIGGDAIVSRSGLTGEQVEVDDVIAAASAGDKRVQAAVDEAGEWLGVGLANLVNLFNPEVIVLGGHLRLLFPLVSGTVFRRIHHALPATREQVRIEVPALGGDSTLLGAAEVAFESLLADPIGVLAHAHHAAAS